MEKRLVLFTSKYGAAAEYAVQIAEAIGCETADASVFTKRDVEKFDTYIYGGGVHAGGIEGWDKFRKNFKGVLDDAYWEAVDRDGNFHEELYKPRKRLICYAVGINIDNFEGRAQLRDVNFDKRWMRPIPCYYFGGRYDPEIVKGADALIMKTVKKMLVKKGLNMDANERRLLEYIENGCDLVDMKQIAPLVSEVLKVK